MKNFGISIGQDSMLQNELEDRHIGYKVVSRVNSRAFKPATSAALQSFRYRQDRETRRNKGDSGAIAIFDTLDHAQKFAKSYGGHILRVEYVPSAESRLWKKNPPSFVRNNWGKGYHAESNGTTELSADECPDGTIFAESVYPLEEV